MTDLIEIKKENEGHMLDCCSDGQYYPYGTSLRLEDDLIESLGIAELIVEDVVEIRAIGFVENKHESSSTGSTGGHESKSIGIQITGLKIKRKAEDDVVKQLYKG